MKKQMPVGLVVEGNVTASRMLRLPCLRDELGPVKSLGLQVARRVSNFMRAGYGVTSYQDLGSSQLILLRVPDSQTHRIVAELCASPLPFKETSFVLCESWLPSDVLAPLRRQGAQIGSLVADGTLATHCFVLEGDVAAVRRTKRLLSQCRTRVIELRPETKPLYFAANVISNAVTVPIFQLAQQVLRESGVSGNDLATLTNQWLEQLQDRVRKGGRGAWGGPLAECSETTANEHFRQFSVQNPQLAAMVRDWVDLARRQSSKRVKGHTA
jgi:predicted short-subunit dehydrogenase-like oxidoreductase (DUF2520 family)